MEELVKFNCPGCKVKVKIPIKHAGKRGKCPKCQFRCTIPGIEADEFDILADLAEIAEVGKLLNGQDAKDHDAGIDDLLKDLNEIDNKSDKKTDSNMPININEE